MSRIRGLSRFEGSKNGPVRINFSGYWEPIGYEDEIKMTVEEAFVAIRGLQLGMIGGDGYDSNGYHYEIKKVYLHGLETTADAIVDLFLHDSRRRRRQ